MSTTSYNPMLLMSFMLIISTMMSSLTQSHETSVPTIITGAMPKITIEIFGVLRCETPPPNPPNNPPVLPQLNGVNVFFSCDDGNTTIAKALTNPNGAFKIVTKAEQTLVAILLDQPRKCAVVVRLPVAVCRVYPPDGLIRAPLGPLVHTHYDAYRCNAGRFYSYRTYN